MKKKHRFSVSLYALTVTSIVLATLAAVSVCITIFATVYSRALMRDAKLSAEQAVRQTELAVNANLDTMKEDLSSVLRLVKESADTEEFYQKVSSVVKLEDDIFAVTVYDGDYDYYLFKRAELEAAETEDAKPATTKASKAVEAKTADAPTQTSGRNVKTKEQRRAEAEARNAASKAMRSTKKRLKEVEAALEPAHKRYDELMELMASEELYADAKKFDEAMAEYNALKKKIPALEEEWLELSTALEEAQSGIGA